MWPLLPRNGVEVTTWAVPFWLQLTAPSGRSVGLPGIGDTQLTEPKNTSPGLAPGLVKGDRSSLFNHQFFVQHFIVGAQLQDVSATWKLCQVEGAV